MLPASDLHIMFGPTYTGACPRRPNLAESFDAYSPYTPDRALLSPYRYQPLDEAPNGRGDGLRTTSHDEHEGA